MVKPEEEKDDKNKMIANTSENDRNTSKHNSCFTRHRAGVRGK